MQLQVLPSELHDLLVAPLDGGPADHRHEDGVDLLAHVLDQGGPAILNTEFYLTYDVLGAETDTLEVVVLLLLLDPGDALQLGVDDEGVTLGGGQDGAVLHRHRVHRQALLVPQGDGCLVGQQLDRGNVVGHRDLVLTDELDEVLVDHPLAVLLVEGSSVGDEGGGEEGVTHQEA